MKDSAFNEQILAYVDGGTFPGIAGAFLESCSENRKFLSFQIRAQLIINESEEHLFPVVIHLNDRVPIVGHLSQSLQLSEIDQCKDILLEAASTPSDTAVQEFIANSSIRSDALLHFPDIGVVLLAHNCDAVNR